MLLLDRSSFDLVMLPQLFFVCGTAFKSSEVTGDLPFALDLCMLCAFLMKRARDCQRLRIGKVPGIVKQSNACQVIYEEQNYVLIR